MSEHVELDLTEAVEAAAMKLAEMMGFDWSKESLPIQHKLKEHVLPLISAAEPFIVEQVSWRYDV